MAALLIGDPELAACGAPFRAVRLDTAPSRSRVRDEMRKLMAQGAIDFLRSMLAQPRIQRYALVP